MRSVVIKGYPNYLVYEDGRIYSNKTNRFLTQCLNRGGYLILNLSRKGEKPLSHRVHRLVAEHFLDRIVGLSDVNHIDGVKTNNHISNLEWSNKSLNGLHAHKLGLNHGQSMPGELHPMAKLLEKDILRIRKLSETMTNREIATEYSLQIQHIWCIVTRRTWKHI